MAGQFKRCGLFTTALALVLPLAAFPVLGQVEAAPEPGNALEAGPAVAAGSAAAWRGVLENSPQIFGKNLDAETAGALGRLLSQAGGVSPAQFQPAGTARNMSRAAQNWKRAASAVLDVSRETLSSARRVSAAKSWKGADLETLARNLSDLRVAGAAIPSLKSKSLGRLQKAIAGLIRLRDARISRILGQAGNPNFDGGLETKALSPAGKSGQIGSLDRRFSSAVSGSGSRRKHGRKSNRAALRPAGSVARLPSNLQEPLGPPDSADNDANDPVISVSPAIGNEEWERLLAGAGGAGTEDLPAEELAQVPAPAEAAAGNYVLLTQPKSGRADILNLIDGAQKYLNLTIYEIEDPQIVSALGAAAKRGVKVRVLYNHYSFARYSHDPNARYVAELQAAGVQAKPAPKKFTVTHQKTLSADGKKAIIMTFNLAPGYFKGTRDFGMVTTDPAQVAEIEAVFDADWNDGPASVSQIALVWSPENSREKILGVINGAARSLEVYGEETEDPESMQALIAAAKRGVAVRFITAILKDHATGKDANAAERAVLNANGVQAKGMVSPYIHAKMVLADYGTPRAQAYLGSENFSKTSLNKNRELGVIFDNPTLLSSVEDTFSSDWGPTDTASSSKTSNRKHGRTRRAIVASR